MTAIKPGVICVIRTYPEHPNWTDRFVTVVAEPTWMISRSARTGDYVFDLFAEIDAPWLPPTTGEGWAIHPRYLRPISDPDAALSQNEDDLAELTA